MVRVMRESDYAPMMRILKQSLEKGTSTFRTECPTYDEWDRTHLKDCRFVYEENGNVLGFVTISPTSNRECYRGVVEVSIYVDENARQRGVGTALMLKLQEESRNFGYWTLYSQIFSINEASIKLHKKCGFREIGYREMIAKDKFGVWQNATLMEFRNDII